MARWAGKGGSSQCGPAPLWPPARSAPQCPGQRTPTRPAQLRFCIPCATLPGTETKVSDRQCQQCRAEACRGMLGLWGRAGGRKEGTALWLPCGWSIHATTKE